MIYTLKQPASQDSWTWEDELDGKGPWAEPGEYRRPKAELEAAKAERRHYEEQERQRCQDFGTREQNLDYTTWEEIDRWAVDPGSVPEPAWDSMEQCEEGYRRIRLATRARRRGRKPERQPQKCIGGGTGRVWQSQELDLSQLPLFTVRSHGWNQSSRRS